jgi:hypothetical protein
VEGTHVALLDRRIRIEGACRINPLMDVIAEGAQAEKLEALGVIYRRYEARLSVVLKRAMQDSDASVRVLAATVIAKLHGTYTRKIGDCQAAAAVQPALAQNWREAGEARIGYAGRLARRRRAPCTVRSPSTIFCALSNWIRPIWSWPVASDGTQATAWRR